MWMTVLKRWHCDSTMKRSLIKYSAQNILAVKNRHWQCSESCRAPYVVNIKVWIPHSAATLHNNTRRDKPKIKQRRQHHHPQRLQKSIKQCTTNTYCLLVRGMGKSRYLSQNSMRHKRLMYKRYFLLHDTEVTAGKQQSQHPAALDCVSPTRHQFNLLLK